MRALLTNADLGSDDDIRALMKDSVTVFGAADSLEGTIDSYDRGDTTISAGSATSTVMKHGIIPDIVVTDLDGDIVSQKEASSKGALTLIHAHGDNRELMMSHAKDFRGRVIMTTQSGPDVIVHNYGGFTDGDRAVCLARHFGAKRITLLGFDYDLPSLKDGSDMAMKLKKLGWAKRIIEGMSVPGTTVIRR